MQKATLGAGCFWGVEKAFSKVDGVTKTEVGYMGGDVSDPSYEDVCSGRTGHVEVCQVTFDESKVTFKELLEVFWSVHDPTQENRQGPDVGTQYRSVIFYHNEFQRKEAKESKEILDNSNKHINPVVTAIEPAKEFYKAEEYHQKYLDKKDDNSLMGQLMNELKKGL